MIAYPHPFSEQEFKMVILKNEEHVIHVALPLPCFLVPILLNISFPIRHDYFFSEVLEIKSRALHMRGKQFTNELHLQALDMYIYPLRHIQPLIIGTEPRAFEMGYILSTFFISRQGLIELLSGLKLVHLLQSPKMLGL